jgi:hypothetical protein
MQKKQTHFEQVPLEKIKWIVEEEIQKLRLEKSVKPKTANEELSFAVAGDRSGGRS